MVKKVDHIGIAVKSLDESLSFYTDILGLPLESIEEVPSQRVKVAFIPVGETRLELLEPTSTDSPIAKFIEKRGEGIHHIALGVESIEARIKEMQENGIKMIDNEPRPGAHGTKVAFLHPKSTGGVLYEFCEK
jgi:methylmalonyl-CoA/ethylmalonyl-CoA epimerase